MPPSLTPLPPPCNTCTRPPICPPHAASRMHTLPYCHCNGFVLLPLCRKTKHTSAQTSSFSASSTTGAARKPQMMAAQGSITEQPAVTDTRPVRAGARVGVTGRRSVFLIFFGRYQGFVFLPSSQAAAMDATPVHTCVRACGAGGACGRWRVWWGGVCRWAWRGGPGYAQLAPPAEARHPAQGWCGWPVWPVSNHPTNTQLSLRSFSSPNL